jgi:hypothetical protein
MGAFARSLLAFLMVALAAGKLSSRTASTHDDRAPQADRSWAAFVPAM